MFLSSVFPMQSTKGHLSEVSTLSENLTKTTVKPISPKLQFFPAKMRNFPTKKAAGVCFPNRVFFSQTQLFHRFLGWLGDSPPHTFHKNTSTARSWINIPTKKHRPVAGEVKPRQSLSKDRYFKAFDSSGLHRGLVYESKKLYVVDSLTPPDLGPRMYSSGIHKGLGWGFPDPKTELGPGV